IADGLSTAYLLRDILQVLGTPNCEQQLLPKRPPFEDLTPEMAFASKDNISHQDLQNSTETAFAPKAVSQLFIADDEPKSNIQTLESTINNPTNLEAILSQSSRPRLLSWSLSKEETSTLINRCRQEQTSVHAAICAAFLLGIDSESDTKAQQNHFQQPSTLRCLSPVNIRRLLSPSIEEDFGYYFCLTVTSHTLTPNLTLWDLARSLKSQLNQQTLPNTIFADIPQMQAFLSTNPSPNIVRDMLQDSKGYDVLVSNLGKLNIQKQFGDLQLTAIYGPIATTRMIDNERFVGVATLEDQMFFTFVYSELDMSPAKVELLQKAAMQQLAL
ncbi:MAG: phthiocerol/phthiodiolone dimycocerosyl transferase family protein, partial [Brasilonema sp.]